MNRRKLRSVLKQYLLIVLLIILVLISAGLSFAIWGSIGAQSINVKTPDKTESDKRLVSEKGIEAVYDFDLVVLNQNGKHDQIINSRRISRDILTNMGDWQIDDAIAEHVDEKTYLKLQNENNTVLLGYPDQVIGGLVESRLNISVGLTDDDRIDRVQLPIDGSGEMRFYTDKTHDVYRAKISEGSKLSKIKWPSVRTSVALEDHGDRVRINRLETIKLKTKSYLLDKVNQSDAVSAAFKSSDVTPQIVKNDGDKISYSDGDDRQMLLDQGSGDAVLTEYYNRDTPKVLSRNMRSAYDQLVQLKQIPENMYYFEENDDGSKLTYRLYVDGLPMFGSENFGFGKVSIDYQSNRQTVDYSLYGLQVPLPDKDEKTVTLPSTNTVVSQLEKLGIKSTDIQGMRIGYSWLENDNEQYITLQPGWFIQIKDKWMPLGSF